MYFTRPTAKVKSFSTQPQLHDYLPWFATLKIDYLSPALKILRDLLRCIKTCNHPIGWMYLHYLCNCKLHGSKWESEDNV